MRVIDWSVARCTVTRNSSPTLAALGPSRVSAERPVAGAVAPPLAGSEAGGAVEGPGAGPPLIGTPRGGAASGPGAPAPARTAAPGAPPAPWSAPPAASAVELVMTAAVSPPAGFSA